METEIGRQIRRAQRTGSTVENEQRIRVENKGRPIDADVMVLEVTIPGRQLRVRGITSEMMVDDLEEFVLDWVTKGLMSRNKEKVP